MKNPAVCGIFRQLPQGAFPFSGQVDNRRKGADCPSAPFEIFCYGSHAKLTCRSIPYRPEIQPFGKRPRVVDPAAFLPQLYPNAGSSRPVPHKAWPDIAAPLNTHGKHTGPARRPASKTAAGRNVFFPYDRHPAVAYKLRIPACLPFMKAFFTDLI